jgi:hypothetical protein
MKGVHVKATSRVTSAVRGVLVSVLGLFLLAGCVVTHEPATWSETRAAKQTNTAKILATYGYEPTDVSEPGGENDNFTPHEPYYVFSRNKCADTEAYTCVQLAKKVMVSQDQAARVIRVLGEGETVYCKVPEEPSEWQGFTKLNDQQRIELLSAPTTIMGQIGNPTDPLSKLKSVWAAFKTFHVNPGPGNLDWACQRDNR